MFINRWLNIVRFTLLVVLVLLTALFNPLSLLFYYPSIIIVNHFKNCREYFVFDFLGAIDFYVFPTFLVFFNSVQVLPYFILPYFVINFCGGILLLNFQHESNVLPMNVIDCSVFFIDKPSLETCAICLESQTNAKLPCGHYIHSNPFCLNWSISNNMCPICKQIIYK